MMKFIDRACRLVSCILMSLPLLFFVGLVMPLRAGNTKLDTTFCKWYEDRFKVSVSTIDEEAIIVFNEEQVKERLMNLDSPIEFTYNDIVGRHIKKYLDWKTKSLGPVIGASKYYFPMIEEVFDAHGIPLELKYLAIVESKLNPNAFSPVGASGLWQFMYSTGKAYGLKINSLVDERRDPLKSTFAAARFMLDLYDIYKDWYLVIAAYNCGPGNVNKAIKRAGESRDIWKIYPFLPSETRDYVPAFIAMTYVMEFHEDYGIACLLPETPLFTDTILIVHKMNLKQVAEVMDIPLDLLQLLNPQYRYDLIPAKQGESYALRLPIDQVSSFLDLEDQIYEHRKEALVSRRPVVAQAASFSDFEAVEIKGKDKLYYRVKSGDNLGFIADWFDVSVRNLRYWNNVKGNAIRVGQRLLVYVPSKERAKYERFLSASFDQKQAWAGNVKSGEQELMATLDKRFVYHQVKPGENPWVIAQQYSDVSVDDILKLNPKGIDRKLKPGQYIKIKEKRN